VSREIYYDVECEQLAEHFLEDEPERGAAVRAARVKGLAQAIQCAVEEWLADPDNSVDDATVGERN
jgi:hypothetical protein